MKKLLNTLYVVSPDTYLRLDGENVIIQRKDAENVRLPLHTLESIVCFTYQGASPALLGKCIECGVDFVLFTPEGRFLARINGIPNGNVLLRRSQYRIADDNLQKLKYAKQFILGKVFNTRWIIERTIRDHNDINDFDNLKDISLFLKDNLSKISKISSISELMGVEGDCAKHYFSVFNDMILNKDDNFNFTGRTRRPPKDCVNAMLSFAYSLLAKDCAAALASVGLDPYVGFLHSDRPGRVSLALDLEEELRGPIADRFVLSMINLRVFSKKMFDFYENGVVFLNDNGRRLFLSEWQIKKKNELNHPFINEKINWGLVPYVQALLLTRTIRGDLDEYPPFLWK